MTVYGIMEEVWNGSCYSCNPETDVRLFFKKEDRDKEFENCHDNADVMYSTFETEIE